MTGCRHPVMLAQKNPVILSFCAEKPSLHTYRFCATIEAQCRSKYGREPMNTDIQLQNLHDCTVQLHHPETDAPIGTGILVSPQGKIATCAPVLRAAGFNPHKRGTEVGVVLPQARYSASRSYRAKISASFPYTDDDLVLLQLADEQVPLSPEQVAVLGEAAESTGHRFRSYAYTTDEGAPVRWLDGSITTIVAPPPGRTMQAPPLRLKADRLSPHMNGAAVLDIERNLVVGLICIPTGPGSSPVDPDRQFQAIDAALLGDAPFSLSLHATPLPLRPAPLTLPDDAATAKELAARVPGSALNNALPPPDVWVGRKDEMHALSTNWAAPDTRLACLVGPDGAGKSSLARRWLDALLADSEQAQPDGVFWWDFEADPSIDAFFESAFAHLSGQMIDTQQYPTSGLRAQLLGAMLQAGRYLLVLDGLERWQRPDGTFHNAALRSLLAAFALPGHQSFCLLTCHRLPTALLSYAACARHHIDPLTRDEGAVLLHQLGVQAEPAALAPLAADLHGHPLTLRLIADYLVERQGGAVTGLEGMLAPADDEPDQSHTARLHHIIERRLRIVTRPERTLLTLLSAFRLPVDEAAFTQVIRPPRPWYQQLFFRKPGGLNAPLVTLSDDEFSELLARLIRAGLICHNPRARQYRLPPRVHAHFAAHLAGAEAAELLPETRTLHIAIKDYYLNLAGQLPHFASLQDIGPLIEAVHHACRANACDEAWTIYEQRIEQGERRVLSQQAQATETLLALMAEFFPAGSLTGGTPRVSDPAVQRTIFDTAGFCLLTTERLHEAATLYANRNAFLHDIGDRESASTGYRSLSLLYLSLGELEHSAEAARTALQLARLLDNPRLDVAALASAARLAHLRGDQKAATNLFRHAAARQRAILSDEPALYTQDRIWYADHLRQTAEHTQARELAQETLAICQEYGLIESLSQCHRLRGELDTEADQPQQASEHYTAAVDTAQQAGHPPTLIEALLARGRAAALANDPAAAFADLRAALDIVHKKGYVLYEADLHMALAHAYQSAGDTSAAQAAVQYARHVSTVLGYHMTEQELKQ